MSNTNTRIGWTDATWNPIVGCTRVSAGCDNCYAARLSATRLKHLPQYAGLSDKTKRGNYAFNGTVRLLPEYLDEPLHWRKPRMVFVCSMSDLFHPDVPLEYIVRVWITMAACQDWTTVHVGKGDEEGPGWLRSHRFQVLTKRPERMGEVLGHPDFRITMEEVGRRHYGYRFTDGVMGAAWPLLNVWAGTSVEDQATADERIPHLLDVPAAVRWVSLEPMLGEVNLQMEGLSWVVVGAESRGQVAGRECRQQWIESVVEQCRAAGVPCFVKQIQIGGLICEDIAEFPPKLQVQEWPKGEKHD
jgi:protein gp37